MSKRKLTYNDFKHYFSNNLQNKDKHAFEKQMMQDAFEEEAFDGLSSINPVELDQDLTELQHNIANRSRKTKRIVPIWFKYAASIIILIGIGASVLMFLNNRVWEDSFLNDQISMEMEIADSVLFDSELAITEQNIDTARKELIALNKEKKPQAAKEKIVIEDDALIAEEIYITEETDSDTDDQINVIAFEEVDEIFEETIPVAERVVADKAETAAQPMIAAKKSTYKKEKLTIKGKVIGAEDNLSIPGVSIVLKDNPAIGTTTNMDGEFELTIPYDDDQALKTLIAQFVGMESTELNLRGDTNLLVYMEPSYLEMDEVVVTALGVKRNAEEEESIQYNAKPPKEVSFNNYKKQVIDNLDFSKLEALPGKHKIRVIFTVNPDGSLGSFRFKNYPNQAFCDEIIRVMNNLGKWIPATENNRNISSEVRFNLIIEVNK